ncbi:hypothetical protein [Enterococcus faecium]|uniref:hypothetical protein n=1 Tax=Enterococcus faecium TaxID=1352 RepID=UPI0020910934|nr:hypothetical protein [Enterococcus faecium]MCO5426215.1 hypothetical protein [Enterococcus faecium]MCO5520305.1 hypothetical protein [Enterococcus faecium]
MKKKYLDLKMWISVIAVTFVLSVVATSGSMIISANELILDETQNSKSNFSSEDLSVYYSEEKKNSELALEKIKEEYGDVQPKFNENGEILLKPEDELRMEQAINQYLAMIGFNPRMRGVGKNWWNSTGFVAGGIDAGLIVLGLGLANSSVNTVKAIIRKNKRNIARVTENVIVAQIGITTVRGKALAAVEIALALAGTSAGGLIAEGLDRVDGRNDNYLWA